MNAEWDAYADDWDSNPDVIRYAEAAFESLVRITALDGLDILDFGCGTGLLTEKMAPYAKRIVAVDSSGAMIGVLRDKELPGVRVINAMLNADTVAEYDSLHEPFHLVVASSVCGFLPDYEDTLGLLRSLMAPDGLFVQWDWESGDDNDGFGMSRETVGTAFAGAGLELVSAGRAFSVEGGKGPMPVLMAVGKNCP